MFRGCFSGGASWKHNKHDPEERRGAELGTKAAPAGSSAANSPAELRDWHGERGFVHKPSLCGGNRAPGSAPHPSIPPVPKGHHIPSARLGRDGTHGIRDQPSLASGTSRGHKSAQRGARLGSCSVPQVLAKHSQVSPERPSPPLPSRQRDLELWGVWRDPKMHSRGSLPAWDEGWIPPSLPSQQLPSAGNLQERKKPPLMNRTWTAVPPPSPSVPPFLLLLLPGSVLLCLPFSPRLSRGAGGDREQGTKTDGGDTGAPA